MQVHFYPFYDPLIFICISHKPWTSKLRLSSHPCHGTLIHCWHPTQQRNYKILMQSTHAAVLYNEYPVPTLLRPSKIHIQFDPCYGPLKIFSMPPSCYILQFISNFISAATLQIVVISPFVCHPTSVAVL